MASAPTYQEKLYSSDNWKRRRLFLTGALMFIGFHVTYLIFRDSDTQLARDTASTLIYAGMGLLVSYIFGAVADDWDKRKKLDPPPAEDPIPPPVPPAE